MKTTDALTILDELIGDDPQTRDSIAEESSKQHMARLIYGVRATAGLTQKELAHRIGTSQSVIARLEDADYGGHSLTMLRRIADALNLTVAISLKPKHQGGYRPAFLEEPATSSIKFVTQRPQIDAEAYKPKRSDTQANQWANRYRQVRNN